MILIVAIPDGLPIAISLATAFSIDKLKADQVLLKNVQSIQKLAMCNYIMVSKTGCLTTAEMKVAKK